MYSLSSDYSALSSAIDSSQGTTDSPIKSDETSFSKMADCASSYSDNETVSEPDSMECNEANEQNSNEKDTNSQKAPGMSYIALISMAIQSSSDKRMLLSEIYQWISERYPYYNMKEKSWRNSIRHNLSLNECFVKNGRSENGKGNYWSIHPANIEDFSKGDYRRRRARRLVRKCDEDLQRLCTRSPYPTSPSPTTESPPTTTSTNCDGYVPMTSTKVPRNFLSSFGVDSKTHDEWNFHNFPYHASNSYRPCDIIYSNEPCSQLYQYSTPDPYTGMYTPGSGKHSFSRPTAVPSELNVNVNVNVCGSTGSSMQCSSPSSPSCYVSPCPQVFKPPYHHGYSYAEPALPFAGNNSAQGLSECSYNGQEQDLPYSTFERSSEGKE